MSRLGSLYLLCITLLIAGSDAARRPYDRGNQRNPYYLAPSDHTPELTTRPSSANLTERSFTLRHIYHHGTNQYPSLHKYIDVKDGTEMRITDDYGQTYQPAPVTLRAKSSVWNIERLADRSFTAIDSILEYSGIHGRAVDLPSSAWTIDPALGPNITDKETVLSFAKMAQDAYVPVFGGGEWMDVAPGFNYTDDFGWENDGLRGHIFADETNRTIVIGLKGTSPAVFDGADTTGNDKLNDNLFGSCCCGQGGWSLWKQVCDCMTSTYTCNSTCLVTSLKHKSHYYWAVQDLYRNVTERYPDADVWLTGHSLGGVVSSLLGLTFGLPTLTFEAYPDALASARLGLPVPPGYSIGSHQSRAHLGVYHFGHTADPIYMGTCNGATSFCTIAGYAFQGLCHTGKTCIFDTVGDLGWRVGIGTHKISNVIKDVLMKYDTMPKCEEDLDCKDCFNWKFFESNGTETTTTKKSSTKTATRTRTETCKTPGWWGCLDESTTTGATTTTSRTVSTTSTTSTSTCKTPGWFGCKDSTTTSNTKSSKTASPAPTLTSSETVPTTSCETPGWFGCKDPTSTTVTSTVDARNPARSNLPLITSAPTRPTPSAAPARRVCARRHWYGSCREWTYLSYEYV
ncbi:hypothetical protein AMS68_000550 [Peltaster fructicola]|uniref:triacylglycerol lipase n=1 Tax=Peltaster fructicola TaxID=286661 RepID=A0A6H0XJX3_9PEZI|nr:hypothetical protein AMS68_000550 [Peltaster fructicola]